MIKVGLTGTIGSGKSTVALIFGKLGVPIYYSDQYARELLGVEAVKIKLQEIFGFSIFNESGHVQRSLLAQKVFNDPAGLNSLNNLIHPMVKDNFEEWLKKQASCAYIIHEAAILFESGFYRYFDKVIIVDAPQELSISRVMQRDCITREKVLDRMKNQWNREKKVALADYIILNDGKSMLLPQVLSLHAELNELVSKH